ncbi:MAG TPA: SIMPL domain-containing protein [Candidatus Aquilonibacter sp.]|nr:SIMPL domain-containing protein [Candidatus Aquilonibacter sp.]
MKSFLLLLALCVVATACWSQEHPTVTALPNTVYVGADGKFEAAPDTAVLQFDVSVQAENSQAAYQQASKDVEEVRQVFRANGVEPKAATIGFFSVQPTYEWKNGKQKPTGYRVTTDVTLKLKDFSKIGPIVGQLADANVSERQTLNYTLENMDQAKDNAVADAYRHAHDSADALAVAAGRTVGELSYASIDISENQRMFVPHMMRAMAAPQAVPAPTEEFTPQNVTITAHVNAVFNLK